jgi:hypothetical protein
MRELQMPQISVKRLIENKLTQQVKLWQDSKKITEMEKEVWVDL